MNLIDRFTLDTVNTISLLVKENLYTQALIILYSAIDTLAWADKPSGDVTRSEFCAWVSKYIEPDKNLGCTSEDLYAARCALVHSSATQSKMSREGQASEIWYATSPSSVQPLQEFAKRQKAKAKIVYFTDLLACFVEASHSFASEISRDESRQIIVDNRIRQWIRFQPVSLVLDTVESDR
ncbi:MAG: hypothetical protein KJ069_01800 [Anaerolineae bacterium]|nr:hypothetical protein [Anaerolineae bacterium]